MDSINQILYAIDSINSNELIAEGTTISIYEQWVDKMTFLMEHAENFEDLEIVQEAKSVGTGVTSSKGDSLIRRIWDFIRKVVHAVINKISDIATKIKIHNYSYVEIPMEYNDIKADVDDISGIWDGIAGLLIHEDTSDIENYDYSKDAAETKKLLDKVNNLRILNVKSDNKRYGVKPEVFMTMRDKLRYLNQQVKDVSKRTDAFIKSSEKIGAFKNKSYEQYCRATQQLFAKMHEASTKLFASFKFKNATKTDAEVKIVKKLQQIDNGLNQLREIVKEAVEYDIDDGEWIDETEKPFDEWLKKHDYDSSNNTIMLNGKRHDAGKVPSKKERNRINRFLRENNYDPKTETIETDITDKDGSNKRIKFNMINSKDHSYYNPASEGHDEFINIDKREMVAKPQKSNQTLKHEEGHAAQTTQPGTHHAYSKRYHKSGNTPVSTTREDLHDFIDSNPVDRDHYQDFELDADLYGFQHNRYASKNSKTKSGLNSQLNDKKDTERINKQANQLKENKINEMTARLEKYINRKISMAEDAISGIEYNIAEVKEMLSRSKQYNAVSKADDVKFSIFHSDDPFGRNPKKTTISDMEEYINKQEKSLEKCKQEIKELQKDLSNVAAKKYDNVDDYNKRLEDIDREIDDAIKRTLHDFDQRRAEISNRNKFLDQHVDEAGSKARKLEGRQGKHKGKHK